METLLELPSTFAEVAPAMIDVSSSRPSTLDRTGFVYGAAKSLPPTHVRSREVSFYKLNERLMQFRILESGWDGYDGQPATFGSFTDAMTFTSRLPVRYNPPASMLTGDGEISLFWKKQTAYLELSFPGDGTYHFIYKGGSIRYASRDIDLSVPGLDAELLEYLERI